MKDTLITTFALTMFTLALIFGAWVALIAMLIIFPIAILRCMFDTNTKKENESL